MADTSVEMTTTTHPQWATRWALPYIHWFDGVYYLWDTTLLLMMFSTLIDAWNAGAWLYIGLLIAGTVVSFIWWIVNGVWFMPNYATRAAKEYETTAGGNVELLIVRTERTYPSAVRADLKAHNAQQHFQTELFRYLVIIIFIACFFGQRGLAPFQPLAASPTNVQISDYVLSKLFQVMLIGVAALSFAHLGETRSDLIYRHLTAMNERYMEEHNGRSQALPMRSGTGFTSPGLFDRGSKRGAAVMKSGR